MWDRSCHLPSRLLHATCFFRDRGNSSWLDPHSTVKIYERKIPAPGCGEAKESHEGCNMTKHHKSFTLQSPSFEVSCTPLRIFFGTPAGSVFSYSCFWRDPCSDTRLKTLESSIDTLNLFVFSAKFLSWLYHREGQCLRETGVSAYAKSPLSPLEKSRHTLHTLQLKVTPLYEASYARGPSKLRTPRLC